MRTSAARSSRRSFPPSCWTRTRSTTSTPRAAFCCGRPAGRLRPDGPQDYRGHLRRLCPSRRRCVQRQGPQQGGPFRRLCRPLGRQNVVAAGLATKCEVELAYAIGVAKPVSIMVDTFGTGTVADEKIEQAVEKVFDLTPAAIIRDLDLRKPIYRQLAAYGHMGREDLGVKWENTDRVDALKAAVAVNQENPPPGGFGACARVAPIERWAGVAEHSALLGFYWRGGNGRRGQDPHMGCDNIFICESAAILAGKGGRPWLKTGPAGGYGKRKTDEAGRRRRARHL